MDKTTVSLHSQALIHASLTNTDQCSLTPTDYAVDELSRDQTHATAAWCALYFNNMYKNYWTVFVTSLRQRTIATISAILVYLQGSIYTSLAYSFGVCHVRHLAVWFCYDSGCYKSIIQCCSATFRQHCNRGQALVCTADGGTWGLFVIRIVCLRRYQSFWSQWQYSSPMNGRHWPEVCCVYE